MNGVIYCRVSSKEQVEGTSLEFQEASCREYAANHDINVLKVFVERGESAKFADRTELLALIDYCRSQRRKVEAVIVWKLDRFSRNVTDHFSVKATLWKYGARIVSVTEPIAQGAEGKLMETILAGFAQFDNDIRAVRTVQGMRRKIQDGIYPRRPPLGYRSAGARGEKKTAPDIPDEPLFGLLQRAWQEFATGAYTKAEILRLMTSWGIVSRAGKPLSPQHIDKLFTNKFYAGILTDSSSKESYTGRHTQMVSHELFEKVQRHIHRRHRSIPHLKERDEFPLRGLVRCPSCRGVMTGAFSRGRSRKYPYYACARKGCSERESYPTSSLHDQFDAFLLHVSLKPDMVKKLEDEILAKTQELRKTKNARRDQQQANLARLKHMLAGLIQMRAEGLISTAEFVDQKAQIETRLSKLQRPLDDEEAAYDEMRRSLSKVTAPLVHLHSTWHSLPTELRPRFKRLLMPLGFVANGIRTATVTPVFSLFGDSRGPNTTLVPPSGLRSNQLLHDIQAFADFFRDLEEYQKTHGEVVRKIQLGVPEGTTFEPEGDSVLTYEPIDHQQ